MLDVGKFKAGENLECTLSKVPRARAAKLTLERLMRLDPAARQALRRAQRLRRQRLVVYNRGNRDWVSRERPAKVVRLVPGASWTLPFNFDIARDLASVAEFVTIKTK
jgi:hypothetical protein